MSDEQPQTDSVVHSRWRPIGGWLCIMAIGYELFLLPISVTVLQFLSGHPVDAVHTDKVLLLEMVAIFVGYRSFEKYHEVASK